MSRFIRPRRALASAVVRACTVAIVGVLAVVGIVVQGPIAVADTEEAGGGASSGLLGAGHSMDLIVQIIGYAATGVASEPFTYTVKVSNLGPDSGDGATLDVDLGTGVSGASATCASSAGGAQCPADLSVTDGAAASGGGKLTATIPVLPAGGAVEIRVGGTYPYYSSLTTTATVTPAAGDTDTDMSTNTVTQQTATPLDMVPVVSKVQDKERVASGEVRTYTVRYENRGSTPIPNVRLSDEYTGSKESSTLIYSVSCGAGTINIACPSWADGVTKTTMVANRNSRLYLFTTDERESLTLPAHSVLELIIPVTETVPGCSIVGAYDVHNSAKMVQFPDLSSREETVNGTITVPTCDMVPVVSKVQDKETVASGEVRTYTVRYENRGADPIPDVYLSDTFKRGSSYSTVEYSLSCGPGTTNIDCPTWADGTTITKEGTPDYRWFNLFERTVTLPGHSVLELVVPVTETVPGCVIGGKRDTSNATDMSQRAYRVTGWVFVAGTITAPACDMTPVLSVTEDKETVASGEVRTYTVRYENQGGTPIPDVKLQDVYWLSNDFSEVEYSMSCGAGTTNIECPAWANNTTTKMTGQSPGLTPALFSERVTLPAHSVLELIVPVKETLPSCLIDNVLSVSYQSRMSQSAYTLDADARVRGYITCVDVSTSTNVAVNGVAQAPDASGKVDVKQGDAVDLTVKVTNSASVAANVPVSITLPNMIDIPSIDAVRCDADMKSTCPSDLAYDPSTRTISGTIPEIRGTGQLTISVAATANAVGRDVLSFIASATAPTEHDIKPEPGTLNPSSVTFGFIPEPIAVPVVPTNPSAVCAPGGGAQWNKPTDDERFTWTLTADRHLVVTTRPAFILDNGDGTRSRTHDYGTPEEAGVISCVPLPATPTVTDPCGAGNASWNQPGDSAAITWRVEGNGHLIATTAAGTNFEDGTNSHDYDTAVETNVEPCPTPSPTPTPDPSSPGPVPTTPAPDPTTPAPTPSATVPTPDPSSPGPVPTTPAPDPTTPAPTPSATVPTPDPSSPGPVPTTPVPDPMTPAPTPSVTVPAPDPSAPGPVPTTPVPDPTTPAPTPSVTVPTSDSGEVPPPAQLNRDLAHTGADTTSLMGVAGVLIVAGIMALTRARRNMS